MLPRLFYFKKPQPTCNDIKECLDTLLHGDSWVKSPFWIAICGPPQSGKSYLLKRLKAEWSGPQFKASDPYDEKTKQSDEKTQQSETLTRALVPSPKSKLNAWISTTPDWPEQETKGVLLPNYLELLSTAILRGAVVGLLSRLYKNLERLKDYLLDYDDWKQANTPQLVLEVFKRRAKLKSWKGVTGQEWKMVIYIDKFERIIAEHTLTETEDTQFLNTFQKQCEYVRKLTDTSLQLLTADFRAMTRKDPHRENIGLLFLICCEGGSFFHTCEAEEGNNCALSRVDANVTCPLIEFNSFSRKFTLQASQTSKRDLVDWLEEKEEENYCRQHLTRLAKDYQNKYSLTVADAISSACDDCKQRMQIRSPRFATCVKENARDLFLRKYRNSATILERILKQFFNLAIPANNQILQILSNIESLRNAGQGIQEFLFKLGLIIRGDGGYRPRHELFLE